MSAYGRSVVVSTSKSGRSVLKKALSVVSCWALVVTVLTSIVAFSFFNDGTSADSVGNNGVVPLDAAAGQEAYDVYVNAPQGGDSFSNGPAVNVDLSVFEELDEADEFVVTEGLGYVDKAAAKGPALTEMQLKALYPDRYKEDAPAVESSSTSSDKSEAKTESDSTVVKDYHGLTVLSSSGGEMIYFEQDSPKYNKVPYGSNYLGSHGCGPTCMAMVVSTFSNVIVEPDEMGDWAVDNGYYVKNVGTAYGLMTAAAEKYGVPMTKINKSDEDAVVSALKEGKLLLTVVSKGDFTRGSHFLLLRGITEDGKLLVADSGNYDRSLMEWDYDSVFSQIKLSYFWVYG